MSGPGVELTEVCPETQRWAFRLARSFAADCAKPATDETIEIAFDRMLDQWRALAATEEAKRYADRDPTDENFGWYAAMQAMGHGVGLKAAFGFRVELPYCEAYPR